MAYSNKEEVTVIILGKTGAGKSLLCNRLLGLDEAQFFFKVAPQGGPYPRETIASNFTRRFIANEEVLLRVLDTPGFLEDTEDFRWLDVVKAFDLANGVITAFIIVISCNDLSPGIRVMGYLMKHLQNLARNTVVVFTRCEVGTDHEDDVLLTFNKKYGHGTAGISFVFSDLRGPRHTLENTIAKIYDRLKEIRSRSALSANDFQDFCAKNLLMTLKSSDIPKENITFEGLRKYEQLQIDLIDRYVQRDVLEGVFRKAREDREEAAKETWPKCSIL